KSLTMFRGKFFSADLETLVFLKPFLPPSLGCMRRSWVAFVLLLGFTTSSRAPLGSSRAAFSLLLCLVFILMSW
ncbi:hypothetical protein KI387_037551, partial [Taxus chinensis]